jgi:hypothetical protein
MDGFAQTLLEMVDEKGRHFAVCCEEVKMNDSGMIRENAVVRRA